MPKKSANIFFTTQSIFNLHSQSAKKTFESDERYPIKYLGTHNIQDLDSWVQESINRSGGITAIDEINLTISVHGTPSGRLCLSDVDNSKAFYPQEIIAAFHKKLGKKIPINLDVAACHVGGGIESKDAEKRELVDARHNLLSNNSGIIFHGGGKTTLSTVVDHIHFAPQKLLAEKPVTENSVAILEKFLITIAHSPNTTKLLYKDGDGKTHAYKFSAIKPESAADLSVEKIRLHTLNEMARFIKWCDEEKIANAEQIKLLQDRKLSLQDQQNQLSPLTDDVIKNQAKIALVIEINRLASENLTDAQQKKYQKYIQYYLDAGYRLNDEQETWLSVVVKNSSDFNKSIFQQHSSDAKAAILAILLSKYELNYVDKEDIENKKNVEEYLQNTVQKEGPVFYVNLAFYLLPNVNLAKSFLDKAFAKNISSEAVNQKFGKKQQTILQALGVSNNNHELLTSLVNHGANPNTLFSYTRLNDKKSFDKSFLMVAIDNQMSPEFIRLLVSKGADVNFKSEVGTTILANVCLANPRDNELIKFLLKSGADFNQESDLMKVGDKSSSVLFFAIAAGDLELTKLLLENTKVAVNVVKLETFIGKTKLRDEFTVLLQSYEKSSVYKAPIVKLDSVAPQGNIENVVNLPHSANFLELTRDESGAISIDKNDFRNAENAKELEAGRMLLTEQGISFRNKDGGIVIEGSYTQQNVVIKGDYADFGGLQFQESSAGRGKIFADAKLQKASFRNCAFDVDFSKIPADIFKTIKFLDNCEFSANCKFPAGLKVEKSAAGFYKIADDKKPNSAIKTRQGSTKLFSAVNRGGVAQD